MLASAPDRIPSLVHVAVAVKDHVDVGVNVNVHAHAHDYVNVGQASGLAG